MSLSLDGVDLVHAAGPRAHAAIRLRQAAGARGGRGGPRPPSPPGRHGRGGRARGRRRGGPQPRRQHPRQ
ncbi:hypothetical protein EGJ92_29645, partial [Pseudomonas aeruginosa]